MIPCQFCGEPATIHLTDILNKAKKESHLCEACARRKKLLPEGPGVQLNVQALVQLILGQHADRVPADDPESLVCPECGMKYVEFRATGRLGCGNDYAAFAAPLAQLLVKVHRAGEHRGKMPKGRAASAELAALRRELKGAVAGEDYERAAALRDSIRQKEVPE